VPFCVSTFGSQLLSTLGSQLPERSEREAKWVSDDDVISCAGEWGELVRQVSLFFPNADYRLPTVCTWIPTTMVPYIRSFRTTMAPYIRWIPTTRWKLRRTLRQHEKTTPLPALWASVLRRLRLSQARAIRGGVLYTSARVWCVLGGGL
jgi:hypothetical protein